MSEATPATSEATTPAPADSAPLEVSAPAPADSAAPVAWTIHTAESWARAILADAVRFLSLPDVDPAAGIELEATISLRRLDDGGIGVRLKLPGSHPLHRITVGH